MYDDLKLKITLYSPWSMRKYFNVVRVKYIFPGELFSDDSPKFDFETTSTYTLRVNVSDGELTDTADFIVYIADVNEPPHVTSLPASLSVGELSSGDVISIGAADPEGGDVSYSYQVSPASGSAYFTGDSDGIYSYILNREEVKERDNIYFAITVYLHSVLFLFVGVITLSYGLDYEKVSFYTITVECLDSTGLNFTSTLDITVLNENEDCVITNLPETARVYEDVIIAQDIYTVNATDPDTADTLSFYMVQTPNEGKFTIDRDSKLY